MTATAPHDPSVERAILGAILLNPDVRDRAIQAGINTMSFHRQPHRLIWSAMVELEQIDLVTLAAKLGPLLDQVGGYSYLTGVAGACPSIAHAATYFRDAREYEQLRRLQEAASTLLERITTTEAGDTAASLTAMLQGDIARGGSGQGRWVHSGELMERTLATLKDRFENPGIKGLTLGYRDLDRLLGGIGPTHLTIIIGRPAHGKTAFALNVLAHLAVKQRTPTAMFSLEMGDEALATRLIASEGRVSGGRLKTGKLRDDDWPAIYQAAERLHGSPFYIFDEPIKTVAELRAEVKALLRRVPNLGCIIIDYVQLLTDEGGGSQSRREAVDKIARGMKLLARGLKIPVIALAQPNRSCETRPDKRPMMGDIRESGDLEAAADTIIAVYRDEVYNPETEDKGIGELIVRKARHGSIGTVRVAWRAEFTRFENLARDDR